MNQEPVRNEGPPVQKKKMNGCLLASIIAVLVAILAVGGCFLLGGAALVGSAKQQAEEESGKLQALPNANPSGLQATGELANLFNPGSDHTDLQRDNKEKEIKGQIVDWNLSVYEVEKSGENYRIQTKLSIGGHGNEVAAFVEVTTRNQEEVSYIEELKTDDRFRFKGYIDGIWLRSLKIEPAILLIPDSASSNNPSLTTAERKVAQLQDQGERQLNQEVEEALAIGNAIRAAKDATADKPIPDKGIPKNVFNDISPDEPKIVVPGNTAIDQARHELELEKIKLERERIEIEREKLKMQKQSDSGSITDEPKIAVDQIPALTAPKFDVPAAGASSATVPAMPGERYPETRLQLLGPADLMNLNLNDVRYAINEMYARRGAVFKNAEISKSFANKEWFKPRPEVNFEEIEKEFSAIEADNLKLLGKERDRKSAVADLYELIDSESNIREGPGANYPIIRKSRKGEVGEHQSAKIGWIKLKFSDGSMGWSHEQNLKSTK